MTDLSVTSLRGAAPPQFRDVLSTLWRRRTTIASVIVAVMTLVTIVVFQLTPRYTADVAVAIDTRKTQVVNIEEVVSGMSPDAATVETEVAVLRSRALSAKLVEKLGLVNDPEFNSELRPKSFLRSLLPQPKAQDPEIEAEQQIARVVAVFQKAVEVKAVPRSYVISINVTLNDPVKAAKVANGLAELYIVNQLDTKFEATQRATGWLSDRLGVLRKTVVDAERAVQMYRSEHKLVSAERGTVNSQQLSELNSQLILVRAERAEKEARLQQARLMVKSGSVSASASVLGSPLIQRLREQEAEVMRKLSELTATYGERHPRIINVQAEIRDLRQKIEEEVSRISTSMANEVDVIRARESSLAANVARLQNDQGTSAQAEVKLRELERDAESSKQLYETFLNRFKETREQSGGERPDARIISMADIPSSASFPKKTLILALALFGSVILGIASAILLDHLDNAVRSGDQIEQMGGGAVLAMIPSQKLTKGMDCENILVEKPMSSLSEAFRTLRASVNLSDVDKPPKCIMVTSSVPSEGKTFVSIGFARTIAQSGQKVILVDTDMRRPRMHKVFKINRAQGLVQVLSGEMRPEDVIVKDPLSGLHILPAGSGAPNPSDLLRSQHMKDLLRRLNDAYDMVILDTPPILAVSDARMLSRDVDKTVFVVRWDSTPRPVVKSALKQLRDAGADISGCVVSQVNVKKHARYGYGDHGYYYGKYKEYYSEG